MSTRTLHPLLWPTTHAIKRRPLAAGAALGMAVLLIPQALTERLTVTHLTTLARIAAICLALGAAFLLDAPATRSTPAVPTRLARNLVRVALAGPTIALWWALTLGLAKTTGHHAAAAHLPVAALTLEAAALLAAALALAAIAQRRTVDGNGNASVVAPAVRVFVAVAWLLPRPVALILNPHRPALDGVALPLGGRPRDRARRVPLGRPRAHVTGRSEEGRPRCRSGGRRARRRVGGPPGPVTMGPLTWPST